LRHYDTNFARIYASVNALRHEGQLSRSVGNQKANGGVGRDVIVLPGWEEENLSQETLQTTVTSRVQ